MKKLDHEKYKLSIKELEAEKEANFRSNMAFIDFCVEYMKNHTNKEWSKQQKRFIDMVYKYP